MHSLTITPTVIAGIGKVFKHLSVCIVPWFRLILLNPYMSIHWRRLPINNLSSFFQGLTGSPGSPGPDGKTGPPVSHGRVLFRCHFGSKEGFKTKTKKNCIGSFFSYRALLVKMVALELQVPLAQEAKLV